MGAVPGQDQIDPEGNYPRHDYPVSFIGGPLDGEAILELSAPPGLEIRELKVLGHPEGFYRLWLDKSFHWQKH